VTTTQHTLAIPVAEIDRQLFGKPLAQKHRRIFQRKGSYPQTITIAGVHFVLATRWAEFLASREQAQQDRDRRLSERAAFASKARWAKSREGAV
jgi:hypothetical protein